MIAKVIIDILNKQVNRTFDYLIPSELEKIVDIEWGKFINDMGNEDDRTEQIDGDYK